MSTEDDTYKQPQRFWTERGHQIVQCGKFTYRWEGDGRGWLEVGDRVVLPANWFITHDHVAKVTAIGSTYPGVLVAVVSRAQAEQR